MIEDLVIDKSKLFTAGKQPKKPKRGRCFAKNKHGECEILLKYMKEDCKTCGFFKTREEFEAGREKALRRLRGLDEITRRNIAEKYKIKFEVLNIPKE